MRFSTPFSAPIKRNRSIGGRCGKIKSPTKPEWRNGRRVRLKIGWAGARVGSNPSSGTKSGKGFTDVPAEDTPSR